MLSKIKFLANEYLNMRKHISDRTMNVLKQVKSFEEKNRQKLYMGLIDEAVKEIDRVTINLEIFLEIKKKKKLTEDKENIEREMLVSAIDGNFPFIFYNINFFFFFRFI